MVTFITAFVFAGVLSAYIFLGRALARQVNEVDLESRARTTLKDFADDVSSAVNLEPYGGLDLTAPALSSTQFEIDVARTLATGGSVVCTALYTYTAPSGSTPGNLTVTRIPPSGTLVAALQNPNWATNEYGAPANPRTILTNISSLAFIYQSAESVTMTSSTTFSYVAPPGTITLQMVPVGASSTVVQVPARSVTAIKLVELDFVTAEPFAGGAAYSTLRMSTGPIMMRNKGLLQ